MGQLFVYYASEIDFSKEHKNCLHHKYKKEINNPKWEHTWILSYLYGAKYLSQSEGFVSGATLMNCAWKSSWSCLVSLNIFKSIDRL